MAMSSLFVGYSTIKTTQVDQCALHSHCKIEIKTYYSNRIKNRNRIKIKTFEMNTPWQTDMS